MFSRTLAQPAQRVAQHRARGRRHATTSRRSTSSSSACARRSSASRWTRRSTSRRAWSTRADVQDRPAREVQHAGQGGREDAARRRATPRRSRSRPTVVQPKVSTAQLAKKYPAVLIVNRGTFKLTLYKNLKQAKTYGIAVGQVGLETPAGLYTIQNKAVNPAWHVPNSAWAGDLAGKVIPGDDPSNPIKARWMGIYDGVGIHGTSDDGSIGSRRLARLHPHAHPGRRGALRPGPGRRPDLHRLAVRRRRPSRATARRRSPPSTSSAPLPASPPAAGRHGGRSGECRGCR